MDIVADLARPPPSGAGGARRALDLSADPAIVTAIANDIGPRPCSRARSSPTAARAMRCSRSRRAATRAASSTPLAEARKRGLVTIALVGYDGGRVAADGLADHVVVSRSQHIPRIQEAQATA